MCIFLKAYIISMGKTIPTKIFTVNINIFE